MNKLLRNVLSLTIVAVSICGTSIAIAGGIQGTGDNFGSGWESDGRGGYRGTGDNFGKGWESNGRGGYRGTGDNFGLNPCSPFVVTTQ